MSKISQKGNNKVSKVSQTIKITEYRSLARVYA